MALPLSTTSITHPGLVHPKNEDSHAVFESEEGGLVLLVCDGMGGMGRGDEASRLSVEVLRGELTGGRGFPPDRLRHALRLADDRVRAALCREGEGNPGSTAVVAYVMDGGAHVAWVGDSRAYHVRAGRVLERTRDHKLVEELVDAGQLTPAQAKASALAHVVTRALGGRGVGEATVRPGSPGHVWKLHRGDRVFLCSDGVCDLVEDDEIGRLASEGGLDEARDRLVALALERGGHDNITVVMGEWTGPDWVEEEVSTPVMRPTRELEDLLDENTLHPESFTPDPLEGQRLDAVRVEPVENTDPGRVTEEIARDQLPGAERRGDAEGLDAPSPRLATPPGAPRASGPPPFRSTPPPAPRQPGQSPAAAIRIADVLPGGPTPPTLPERPAPRPPDAPPAPGRAPDPAATVPPSTPGTAFDWRFLVALALAALTVLGILAWFT